MNAPGRRRGFTLVETMLAVLLMALLASGVAVAFSRSLRSARAADAADGVAAADAAARRAAVASGRPVRLEFDLARDTVERFEDADPATPRARNRLPAGYRVDRVRIDRRWQSAGPAVVDFSAHGWARSYDVHLSGPGTDRWLSFAGLTGLMTEAPDDRSLPTDDAAPRDDAD